MSKVFIDTNLLVYSMDAFDPVKQDASRLLLRSAAQDYQGVISTQVMQELYVATTRKLGADPLVIKDVLHSFQHFEVVTITPNIIDSAIECSIISRIPFWDALIVVAAEAAHCPLLWTEDLNDGQIIRGVRIENPLKRRIEPTDHTD